MNKTLLVVIILLAALLRFWKLDSYPALNADEAAIGYNAYSLLETGKDEHANPWPIHFQSFNDYKPGLYFYLVLPFVRILGLTELAVRIPSALLGVGTVFILYLLVKHLFPEAPKFSIFKLQFSTGEIAALFLAISPWHLHYSRGGWEVNVSTFFITLGLWLFLKGLKNPRYFALCTLSLVLSLYTYHAARIEVPLLVIGLSIIYRKEIKPNTRKFALSGLLAIILLLPLGFDLAKGEVSSRAAGVGLLADPGPLARINEQRGEHSDFQGLGARLLHNKVVNYTLAFTQNWAEHFWGEFLFVSGDEIQRNKVPETGQMYLIDMVMLIVGIAAIAKNPRGWSPILLWLLIAPTAAALTFQSPHALRAQNMVIPLTIISSYGLLNILGWLKSRGGATFPPRRWNRFATSGYLIIGVLVFWSFARYEHMYWVHTSKEYPYSSQYGVKDLVSYIKEAGKKFDRVIVTDRYDQPYILFLFYLKYPPQNFQKEHTLSPRDKFGFSTVRDFDKYEFEPIVFDRTQPENPGSLIIGTDEEIPKEANIIKEIYGENGYLYFEAVAN